MNNFTKILSIFFFITVFVSFVDPPAGGSYESGQKSNYDLNFLLSKNYDGGENFVAYYKNTILGWTGNSKDISKYYMSSGVTSITSIGSTLPYVIVSMIIIGLIFGKRKKLTDGD
tara:strand:+ start:277 stop:621 length:345 start_codon:yes stop_codon:yes gene_type:complete